MWGQEQKRVAVFYVRNVSDFQARTETASTNHYRSSGRKRWTLSALKHVYLIKRRLKAAEEKVGPYKSGLT